MRKSIALGLALIGLGLLLSLGPAARADGLDVKLISITSPVPPGGSVTMVIATNPGATCSGRRQAHFGDEVPLRPLSQVAGPDGKVQWAWPILPGMHPVGIRTVHVDCAQGDRTGAIDTAFDVRF
jgi:hypothetical protein